MKPNPQSRIGWTLKLPNVHQTAYRWCRVIEQDKHGGILVEPVGGVYRKRYRSLLGFEVDWREPGSTVPLTVSRKARGKVGI